MSITYRNIPCNATSLKRNLQVKVEFYRHLICSLKKKKAALKRYIADCSSTASLHIQNLRLTNILIKYCNELNKVETLR